MLNIVKRNEKKLKMNVVGFFLEDLLIEKRVQVFLSNSAYLITVLNGGQIFV